jgi:uncharacterized UPF0160 family protein
MEVNGEITKTALTVVSSVVATLFAVCKFFFSALTTLNTRIDTLSQTIAMLDKNLAVQTAVFESHFAMHDSKFVSKGERDGHR